MLSSALSATQSPSFLFRASLKQILRSYINQLNSALRNYCWCFQQWFEVVLKDLNFLVNMTWYSSPPISHYAKLYHLQERLKPRLIQTMDQILLDSQRWKGWNDYSTVRRESPLSFSCPKGHTTKYNESQAVISVPSAIRPVSKQFFCSKTQRSTSNFTSSLLFNEISSNKKLIRN